MAWRLIRTFWSAGAATLARPRSAGPDAKDPANNVPSSAATQVHGSRDMLQHAIDVARDGMAVFDRNLRLVAWNRAYVDMFGMPPELLAVGTTLASVIRWAAERGIYGPVRIDDFVRQRVERLVEPTDGVRIASEAFGKVFAMHSVRLRDGGIFFTYTDATAQAKSEEQLEATTLTLERRVRERTEELQSLNFELARAKAEAEDANISKTRFLAAASHDLLQPLNAARLYTTALREQLPAAASEDLRRLVKYIDLSLEAVEDILSALLEITQLDAGATRPDVTAFAVKDMLDQLAIEFEPLARSRGLKLVVMPCSLFVQSDRRLLRRLLQNLIANALKYTRHGRVLIGARRSAGALRLEVHDTGVGIPESKHIIIFREFERLPEAAQAAPGAGLGLSIVERLSGVLGHKVTLTSTFGQGSTFRVSVPCAPNARPSSAPRLVSQRSLAGMTVAAIDNETDILAGMETLLRGWDCNVLIGTDLPRIEAALAKAGRPPDVIIADFHVGDLDGLDIIAALRQRYGPRPAVLITADRDPAIRHRAQGADVPILTKPLKPAALRSLLSQWQLLAAGKSDCQPEDLAVLLDIV